MHICTGDPLHNLTEMHTALQRKHTPPSIAARWCVAFWMKIADDKSTWTPSIGIIYLYKWRILFKTYDVCVNCIYHFHECIDYQYVQYETPFVDKTGGLGCV